MLWLGLCCIPSYLIFTFFMVNKRILPLHFYSHQGAFWKFLLVNWLVKLNMIIWYLVWFCQLVFFSLAQVLYFFLELIDIGLIGLSLCNSVFEWKSSFKFVKGIVHLKKWLTLKLFQTSMNFFLVLNTTEYILKTVGNQTVDGTHWLA